MRIERLVWVVGATAAAVAVAASGRYLPQEDAHRHPLTVAVAHAAVCPVVDPARGGATVVAWNDAGEVTVQDQAGGSSRRAVNPGAVTALPNAAGPVELAVGAGGRGGASALSRVTSGLERGLSASSCDAPATSTWFTGLQATATLATDLVLTNVDEGLATVDLSFYGDAGRIVAAGSRSVQVPAGSSVRVALGPLVTSKSPFAVQVTASQGRVAASARTRAFTEGRTEGDGVEWVPSGVTPRAELVIPAVPAGEGARTLQVVNPGPRAAEVALERLTDSGPVTQDSLHSVTVPAESVVNVPVDAMFKGQPGALRLRSTQPVSAGVLAAGAASGGDLGAAASTEAFTGRLVLPLAAKGLTTRLQLANPTDQPAEATVAVLGGDGKEQATRRVSLGPGAWQQLDVPSVDSVVVRVEVSAGSLAGAVVVSGDTGGLPGIATLPLRGESTGDVVVEPVRVPGYASRS